MNNHFLELSAAISSLIEKENNNDKKFGDFFFNLINFDSWARASNRYTPFDQHLDLPEHRKELISKVKCIDNIPLEQSLWNILLPNILKYNISYQHSALCVLTSSRNSVSWHVHRYSMINNNTLPQCWSFYISNNNYPVRFDYLDYRLTMDECGQLLNPFSEFVQKTVEYHQRHNRIKNKIMYSGDALRFDETGLLHRGVANDYKNGDWGIFVILNRCSDNLDNSLLKFFSVR